MNCLRDALGQTIEYGYAHHIQRLMVTGLFAMMYGVKPEDIHKWYLAVYVDAVEWGGTSQHDRHESVRRWWCYGIKALLCNRGVH